MKKKITLKVEDFTTLLGIYEAYAQLTQEEFGNLILTNRQAIASLRKLSIEEVSDTMLYRLYFYFTVTAGDEQSDMEKRLADMIIKELNRRISENCDDKEYGKPRVRK